ncbi:MAG TPA: biopolymer transporter ExbD [Bryobacteraceae bacterium]|nr:biopolymer transporter ExbD [Bryobacteraceae bacterium]
MAFSLGGNGNGGLGGSRFRGGNTLADINIIPLVDVVLVLLIIFMLTAHVMEFGLEVDVPKVNQEQNSAKELPVISITRDGESYLNDKPVNINEISTAVHSRFGANANEVYLRADKGVIWDVIAQVISACSQAQLKVNVVTQPEDQTSKRRR